MNRIINCLINKDISYNPVWFMRKQVDTYLIWEVRSRNKDFIKIYE